MSWSQKADLQGRADSQLLLNDRVLVLAISGAWASVVVPDQPTPLDSRGYPGWIPISQLSAASPVTNGPIAVVTSPTGWMHSASQGDIELSFGTRLPLISSQGNTITLGLPGGATGTVPTNQVSVSPTGSVESTAASVVADARKFLGLSYLWAGTAAFGYDCSGLVYNVYRAHGVTLPRDADAQARVGTAVARAALQAGDLIFFGQTAATVHHVAISLGNGMMLESPQTGYPVRIVPLGIYDDYFIGRRVTR